MLEVRLLLMFFHSLVEMDRFLECKNKVRFSCLLVTPVVVFLIGLMLWPSTDFLVLFVKFSG